MLVTINLETNKTDATDPQARLRFPPIREWNNDDFDVLADGALVGRIMKAAAALGAPWLWTILSYEDRQPVHGYKVTRGAGMAAFAKSWRRE